MSRRERSGWPMSRRQLIGAGAGLSFAGLPGTAWAQGALPVADTHVHLFNAADLPAAAFIRYTLLPAWVSDHRAGRGLVDYFVNHLMEKAITAEAESGASATTFAAIRTTRQSGEDGATFIINRKAEVRRGDPALAQSYEALEAALLADRNYPAELLKTWRGTATMSESDRNRMLANALTEVAEQADRGVGPGWPAGGWAEARTKSGADLASDPFFAMLSPGGIIRLLGWATRMTHSRRKHLRDYLRDYRSASFAPRLLINHLVDYDYWLDGEPRSPIGAQIRMFAIMASEAATDGVMLRTFAPFCPLRLAIERERGTPPLFDRLKEAYRTKQIAGFKLYPPMGWTPSGNRSVGDANFDINDARARTAILKWRSVSRKPMGEAIDRALLDFYTYCGANKVPLMAHARMSNGPIDLFKRRADPAGWEAVAATHGLRLQLGHLIDDPSTFNPAIPSDQSWNLAATKRMLGTTGPRGSMVFGDLSYMPELVDDPPLAAAFFTKLRAFLGDAALRRVSFGSDWIMLAQEKDSERYLAHMWRGMQAARYPDALISRILYGNAVEYLG